MPVKNIYTPTKGIITAIPPTQLPEEATPYCSGVYLKDGEVCSDYGHNPYPIPGVLKTNQLNGIFGRVDQYTQANGVGHLIAHTTTNAYEYNTTTNTWDCITKGQTISDCESVWTEQPTITNGTMETWTGLTDLLTDGAMEVWTDPTTLTNYTLDGDGTPALARESTIIHGGTYSAKVSGGSTYARIAQAYTGVSAGEYHVRSAWVKCSTASQARIYIDDGVTTFYSPYHSGGGDWEYLTAVALIGAGRTGGGFYCDAGSATAYFDDAIGYEMLPPTGWTLTGSGATIVREEGTVYSGTYSSKLTRNGTDCYLTQALQTFSPHPIAYWKGRTITLSMRVNASVANRVRLRCNDGTPTYSSYHTGDSTWQLLTMSKTISASATFITVGLIVDTGDTTAYFDVATISESTVTSLSTSPKLRGTYSSKIAVGANFTLLAGYKDVSSLDLRNETGVHFWIYSTVALASGDLLLLLDNTSACVSPLESLTIPAISANTWTPVYIAYASASALSAIISVGLCVNNSPSASAFDVYLDDIRSVDAFTGTASNLFCKPAIMNDTFIISNGVNQPRKYLGVPATGEQSLTTTLATGSITTSEIVIAAKDHLVLLNNTENAADAPARASWTNIGQIEDLIGGTAGYQDLTDDEGWIIAVEQFTQNSWIIYKENSIVAMDWVGGQTPFRFTTMVKGKDIAGKSSVINVNGVHYVLGLKDVYKYEGRDTTAPIDTLLKRTIFDEVNYSSIARSFFNFIEEDDELQLFIPTNTDYPDTVYCYDTILNIWYKKKRSMNNVGTWVSSSALTIGDLVGTIGDQNFTFGSTLIKSNTPIFILGDYNGQVFKLDKTTYNNNGVAITNEFQTPDFIFPQSVINSGSKDTLESLLVASQNKTGQETFFRADSMHFEAKGQSVTVEYSIDGGSTWNPCEGNGNNTVTLTSTYKFYDLDFDTVCRQIRFRFLNTSLSSSYCLRYYGFSWKPRSTRR